MKKTIFMAIVICVIIALIFVLFNNTDDEYLSYEGSKFLLHATLEQQNGIVVYDYSNNEYDEIMLEGSQALFGENDSVLIKRFDSIVKYDYNLDEENVIYSGERIDYFTLYNENQISCTSKEQIFLFDHSKNYKNAIVNDNGSRIHSWTEDGNCLYYSDLNYRIKRFTLDSGDIEYVCDGQNPIVNGTKMAYKNNGELFIRDLFTNETVKYSGSAYSYCFSPDGKSLLVEDEISLLAGIKNNILLGHCLVAWEYKIDKSTIVVESCLPTPNMICDWK